MVLEELRLMGEYQTRQAIRRSIEAQDPELNRIEMQMISFSILAVTSIVGMLARRFTTSWLNKAFE